MCRRRFTVGLAIATVGLLANKLPFSTALLAADTNSTHQFVEGGVLISLQEPSLAIDVDDAFTFVGRHPFTIRDIAAGERFVLCNSTIQPFGVCSTPESGH